MKEITVLLSLFLLTIGINANFLRYLQQSSTNSYSYADYTATSKDANLENQQLTNSNQDESVVYITTSDITISGSTLTKESGDSSNIENSEFYGVNAAVLVQGGKSCNFRGRNKNKSKRSKRFMCNK